MPELPEVETMRRGILAIVGRRIGGLKSPRSTLCPIQISPRLATFRRRVVGASIESVDRLGKRVIVNLDSGDHIIFEPRMSGLVTLNDAPGKKHIRLIFELEGRPETRLLFWNVRGLGTVYVLDDVEMAERLGPRKLGPDALQLTGRTLRERLGKSASGRSRLRCSTKGPWPASATSTLPRFCTVPAFIPKPLAVILILPDGTALRPRPVRCLSKPSSTKAPPSRTAPTGVPITRPVDTSSTIECISGRAKSAGNASVQPLKKSSRPAARRFFCPRCQRTAKRGT